MVRLSTCVKWLMSYLYKKPVIGEDETEKNEGADADERLQSVWVERILHHYQQIHRHFTPLQGDPKIGHTSVYAL